MENRFLKRRILAIVLMIVMAFSHTACSSNQESGSSDSSAPETSSQSKNETPTDDTQQTGEEAKILVAYFSMPETSDPDNMTQDEDNSAVVIDGEVLGNTQYVAYLIQQNTGADIFRIEPANPYPIDHDALVELAEKEQDENARPELAENVEDIAQYDIIFLGYPNWWGDMPMIMYTFLENIDLSGKTIIPFNTHGGSGFSDTISTIADLAPDATVTKDGFTVSRNNVADCQDDVLEWLREMGMINK